MLRIKAVVKFFLTYATTHKKYMPRLSKPLSGCFLLLLTLNGGLFVVLLFAHIAKDIVLLALALKTLECAVERFVFAHTDYCHYLHLLRSENSDLLVQAIILYSIILSLSTVFSILFQCVYIVGIFSHNFIPDVKSEYITQSKSCQYRLSPIQNYLFTLTQFVCRI